MNVREVNRYFENLCKTKFQLKNIHFQTDTVAETIDILTMIMNTIGSHEENVKRIVLEMVVSVVITIHLAIFIHKHNNLAMTRIHHIININNIMKIYGVQIQSLMPNGIIAILLANYRRLHRRLRMLQMIVVENRVVNLFIRDEVHQRTMTGMLLIDQPKFFLHKFHSPSSQSNCLCFCVLVKFIKCVR